MDPFRASLAKALTGEPGDKRNTKYALAGLGGYAVGINVGNQLGARSAGTTLKQNRNEALATMQAHTDARKGELAAHPLPQETRKERKVRIRHNKDVKRGKGGIIIPEPKIPTAANYQPSLRTVNAINNSIKGTKAIHRGGEAGAVLGALGGLAAYGAYRKHKRDRVAKYWEGTPKPERRKPAFTDAALGAATGMAVGGAAAYALTRGKGSKTTITRTITRTLKPKVSRPKAKPEPKAPEPKPPAKASAKQKVLRPKNEVPDAIPNRDPDVQLTPRSVQEIQRENGRKREAALRIHRWKQAKAAAEERAKAAPGVIPKVVKAPSGSTVSRADEDFQIANPAAQAARAKRRANAQMHGKPGKKPRRNAFGVNE